MSETLSRRVGRLVSGGFHALIDAAENLAPEAVMNESIREIENAVDEVRAELGKVLAQKHLAAKKMADEKNRLSEAIESAVEKTLNSATEATSPHPEEYWYNLKTGQVERGQQSAVTSLWGPFKTYEEAAHAMDRARERNDAWEKDDGWL